MSKQKHSKACKGMKQYAMIFKVGKHMLRYVVRRLKPALIALGTHFICTLHTARCTLHNLYCTLHNAHCTLQTVYCYSCSVVCERKIFV